MVDEPPTSECRAGRPPSEDLLVGDRVGKGLLTCRCLEHLFEDGDPSHVDAGSVFSSCEENNRTRVLSSASSDVLVRDVCKDHLTSGSPCLAIPYEEIFQTAAYGAASPMWGGSSTIDTTALAPEVTVLHRPRQGAASILRVV
jgi:hypothetical protein